MTESHEVTIDISEMPYEDISYYEKLIPIDCHIVKFIGKQIRERCIYGVWYSSDEWELSTRILNKFIKDKRPNIRVLDFSGCSETTVINSGFRDLPVETIILPPKMTQLPTIFGCSNLVRIAGKGLTKIDGINRCPLLEHIEYSKALTYINLSGTNIRELDISILEEIPPFAFAHCRNLERVKLSSKLKSIKEYAFEDCASLYKVDIPDHCEIEESAFEGCTSLRYLRLPNTLTKLNKNVFANCTNLQFVTGGENIQEICSGAFLNCEKLRQLPFSPKDIDENTFEVITTDHYGIILSNRVIWCFDTFSFYYSEDEEVNKDHIDCIVRFSAGRRLTYKKSANSIDVNYNPCQFAVDILCVSEIDGRSKHFFNLYSGIKSFNYIQTHSKNVTILSQEVENTVLNLDINKIISGYHTNVEEYQTWKVGGDNSFYRDKKTSYVYTDAYLEQFLPIYDEEYSESACYDYSKDIDYDIQTKQDVEDAELRESARSSYNQKDHINCLLDFYIKSYMENYKKVQDKLKIDFAKDVMDCYMKIIYRRLYSEGRPTLALLCSGETPPLNYKEWCERLYYRLPCRYA